VFVCKSGDKADCIQLLRHITVINYVQNCIWDSLSRLSPHILHCDCFNLFCNVWVCVCVGFVMCGCVYVWVL